MREGDLYADGGAGSRGSAMLACARIGGGLVIFGVSVRPRFSRGALSISPNSRLVITSTKAQQRARWEARKEPAEEKRLMMR